MIFRLPESKAEGSDDRKAKYEDKVKQILHESEVKSQPVEIIQIGAQIINKQKEKHNDRPLRVSFASQTGHDEALMAFNRTKQEGKMSEQGQNVRLCSLVSMRLQPNGNKKNFLQN